MDLTNRDLSYIGLERNIEGVNPAVWSPDGPLGNEFRAVARHAGASLFRYGIVKLAAERNILPEVSAEKRVILPDCRGLTNSIAETINKRKYNTAIVQEIMLDDINKVLSPDISLDGIEVQQHKSGEWEIFVLEHSKGRIALSACGSGLKTAIAVTALFNLLPSLSGRPVSEYIYLFEELESHLHPALQRRLIDYIIKKCVENDCAAFITSHSAAIIDMFSSRKDACILHVIDNEGDSRVDYVKDIYSHSSILDSLGVRASDLLQANCLVWLEGPSDRVYFNKWIEIETGGGLHEGVHYQCVFYGGRLLSHFSADESFSELSDLVYILRINRRAIIIMDSDRRSEGDSINETKRRIIDEFEKIGGVSWVTFGREVENYVTSRQIDSMFKTKSDFGRFDAFGGFLAKAVSVEEEKRFLRDKIRYARELAMIADESDIRNSYDLGDQVLRVVKQIKAWNE